MAWSITDYFPSWGDSGEQPASGFNYQGGDQVNEKHLDYLWSSLHDIQEELQAALEDIDSDKDGVVDEADFANDVDSTAIAGDGLKASGGDLLIEPADFAGSGLVDDGSDNLEVDTSSLVTDGELSNHVSNSTAHHSAPSFASERGSVSSTGDGNNVVTISLTNTYKEISFSGVVEDGNNDLVSPPPFITSVNRNANNNIDSFDMRYYDSGFDNRTVYWYISGVIA